MKITVVIPVYKKTEEFIDNLRNNLPYLTDCVVVVVNDDPEKSIKDEISVFDKIRLIENKKNKHKINIISNFKKLSADNYNKLAFLIVFIRLNLFDYAVRTAPIHGFVHF